jgi:hypothetical protein
MQYAARKSLEGFYINATSPFRGFGHRGLADVEILTTAPFSRNPKARNWGFRISVAYGTLKSCC